MTETTELREQAQRMADALGIAFYVRDGRIYQGPPGDRVEPHVSAGVPHGFGPVVPVACEVDPVVRRTFAVLRARGLIRRKAAVRYRPPETPEKAVEMSAELGMSPEMLCADLLGKAEVTVLEAICPICIAKNHGICALPEDCPERKGWRAIGRPLPEDQT